MNKVRKFGDKKIRIRFLGEEDKDKASKMNRFANELVKDETAFISSDIEQVLETEDYQVEQRLEEVNDKKAIVLIAENDKNHRVIGRASITPKVGLAEHVGLLEVHILKNYRGLGLGDLLMDRIIQLASKELDKVDTVRLSVFSNNEAAIGLSKKKGFKKIVEIPKQVAANGIVADEVIMLKKI
jgi:ribosomal protein S18 acetylase RimI-like enzyme